MNNSSTNDSLSKSTKSLKLNLIIDLLTVLPVVVVAILSNSMLLFTDLFDYIKSITSTYIGYHISKKIEKGETEFYDYGTGKIEVLTGLMTSIIMIVGIAFLLYEAISRIFTPTILDPDFIMLGVLIHSAGLGLNGWLWYRNYAASAEEGSPIMHAQWRSNRADAIANAGILTSLILLLVFHSEPWSVFLDPICAICFVAFPLFSFVNLSKKYISDLSDRTLEESLQIKILKRLTEYFDSYESFSGVRSRRSGRTVFIDIFLGFHPDKTYGEVKDVCERICADIEADIDNSDVQIIVPTGARNLFREARKNEYQILPLSAGTLPMAFKLIEETFALSPEEMPSEELEESVYPGKHTLALSKIGISDPAYWVVYHKGEVCGLSGYYFKPEDRHEAVWGGWAVYDERTRTSLSRLKFAMLKKILIEAHGTHKKYFRLYTSTDPVEAQANALYDRLGLKVYYTEYTEDGKHLLLYRQAELETLFKYVTGDRN